MKLLAKYNWFNLTVTVIIMGFAAIIYYFTIRSILSNQVDKALLVEENEVFNYVKLNKHLPQVFKSNHQQINFTIARQPVTRQFIDTTFLDQKENELEPARAIISKVNVNGENYKILVILSRVETEDLIEVIFIITIGLITILVMALLIINRLILGRIWKPFYQILEQLKLFNLADHKPIHNVSSTIEEFIDLDQAVGAMTLRVKNDYQSLKAFTENASHELMTPIAVINSKLDTLVQTDQFTEKQSKLLNDIYGTVARLTRLNKSMLLLAKIENRMIRDDEDVNMKEIVEECLYQHEEIIQSLNIDLIADLQDKQLHTSKLLMEVLLNNLISNALRHNYANGKITITLQPQQLIISNTGKSTFDIDQVLKRFQKSNESEGIGLGLTICNQICDNYDFKLQYHYINEMHTFSVNF